MNASAKTSHNLSNGHADDALSQAVLTTMRPGWIALRGCVLDAGDAAPAPVRYALLHPQVGIALLDVVPGRTTPHAPDHLRRALDAAAFGAEFGCIPTILYFCIPVRALPDAGYLLEHEFSRQPPAPLPRGEAWVTAAQAILSAQPLPPPRPLAGRMDDQPLRHAAPAWQPPARRFDGGARLLAGFWGLAALTVGGGALFLHVLGPPERAAQAAAPLSVAKADASGPTGADLRRTLIENDRATRELQDRLKEARPDAGSGMVANAVLTSATLPGAAVERSLGTAARVQEVADISEETDAAPALPTQEATPRPADVAGAEAAQKRLADTNAQGERAGQQLATPQRQSEDAQTTGAAMGKQFTNAQAQLSQLEERRSAAEQQLQALQAQADRAQADQAAVEQQLAAAKAQLVEQQAKTLAAQADRGKKDASDALPPKLADTVPAASRDSAAVAAPPSVAAPSLAQAQDLAAAALTETMIRRGDALLQRGDISAARLLYDRAASAGSARAATAMGKTYDATVLAGIGVVGLSPDPALAVMWYRRGLSLGDEEARTRLPSLPSAAGYAAARAERP